jgi:hypothetical protein
MPRSGAIGQTFQLAAVMPMALAYSWAKTAADAFAQRAFTLDVSK